MSLPSSAAAPSRHAFSTRSKPGRFSRACSIASGPATAAGLRARPRFEARGYAAVATFGTNVFFVHPTIFRADERPHLATFDVFDTLIARRCVDPWRVFEEVGALHGLPDFAEKRQTAERRLLPGDYGLDDIYREVAAIYGLDAAAAAAIQETEITCEMNNVIPIAENMARVKHGDLLISDMYLSEEAIRDLLAAAGLDKNVGLSVATHGKSKGQVWPKVAEHFVIERHLGDNPHADFAMPQRFGLTCELTKASAPNPVEQALLQAGLSDLARLSREARLTSWHPDPRLRLRQTIQTSLNFPLLLLSSIVLSRLTERMGRPPLLFCSRDCNLWLPLFAQVRQRLGLPFDARYFLTSRIARVQGSDAYLAYTRQLLGSSGVMVDLCGTGWSMAQLAQRLGVTGLHVFLIDHCPPLSLYEAKQPTPDTCIIHSLMRSPPGVSNSVLELANTAEHGMHVDVRQIGGSFVPVFAADSPGQDAAATAVQREAFLRMIGLMEHYALRDVFELDDASLAAVCLSLYQVLSQQASAFAAEAPGYLAENAEIVKRLVA